ncbi:hypothetical protein EG328_004335 [Venturia inaequalis]|uniref:Uncharacterized protein n=1 Tax=Venturia inaequalis TaxID=5025 RepID=A0A8H3VFU0_VENIN|nr:hypothetical protein EG328_004335 [Venturia inaequalis]
MEPRPFFKPKSIGLGTITKSLIGYPGPSIDEDLIKARQKSFQKALFYCNPTLLDDEGMRIMVHSGIDPFVSFDIHSDHCRANVLAAWTEVADTGNMTVDRLLLSMALMERYWHQGHFDMQNGYIYKLCKNKAHPELWLPRVTVEQTKTIRKICYALRWQYRLRGQNVQSMDPEELSAFQKNEMLVKILFPEDFVGKGELNQAAVTYRPLKFSTARGKPKVEHPTHEMPSALFQRIKEFFLKPDPEDFWTKATTGSMRDPAQQADENMDEDFGDSKQAEEEEEDKDEFDDGETDDSVVKDGDYSMDLLTQDVAGVELREGAFEALSLVAGKLEGLMLSWKEEQDNQMID